MSNLQMDLANVRSVNGNNLLTQSAKSRTKDTTSLDMTDFLKMMVAQFQNQDPENAASSTDMLNQMVQMSMIQAITDITATTTMLYTGSLVGKDVTVGQYDSNGNLEEIVGKVTGSGMYNSAPVIYVDGVRYDVSSILAVGTLPDAGTK